MARWVFFLTAALALAQEEEVAFVVDRIESRDMLMAALTQVIPMQNETCIKHFSCCFGSHMTLPALTWTHVKSFASNYHVRELLDSTPRMLERHYTFYNLYDRLSRTNSSQVWAADCYFGLVSILLNALPAIEFEQGLPHAQDVLAVAKNMLRRNTEYELANWTIPMEPLELQFPFFLGVHKNNCGGSKLKIFVYDTGNYSRGSLFCSAGQWGVEVAYHRYFDSSACKTDNPEEADFFLVPDYRACHLHLAPTYQHKGLTLVEGDDFHSAIIRNHRDKYREVGKVEDMFKDLVKRLAWFPRKRGLDHIFIFSDQGFIVNFTHTFPSWREHISNSIFLTTEAFTPGCGPSCFSPWKDIVIPGHLDLDRMKAIRNWSLPSSERKYLFNFHGRLPLNHDYYENNTVRRDILKFAHLPNVSVGGFIEEYFEVMGQSHFCLVPEGTSSWTNHLYESFFAGCIPFILSDHYVLPFQDLIPWEYVSVKWPQTEVGEAMFMYIYDFVHNRRPELEAMKKRVEEAACWFDFYNMEGPCSPYRGVTHALEKRLAAMPNYLHPPHWAT